MIDWKAVAKRLHRLLHAEVGGTRRLYIALVAQTKKNHDLRRLLARNLKGNRNPER